MNRQRMDAVLQHALAAAADEDDFRNRELGPIHLLKYAYLADLAFARRHEGETYTGAQWRFYHFGPWAQEAFDRIEPALEALGAQARTFTDPRGDDRVRWRLANAGPDRLPTIDPTVRATIRRAVHEFGSDTAGLLHHVYRTRPMIKAAPGENLDFASAVEQVAEPAPAAAESKPMSKTQLKLARERIKQRLAARANARKPGTSRPPRYDEVFYRGLERLHDFEAGPLEPTERLVIVFSPEVWKSGSRADDLP